MNTLRYLFNPKTFEIPVGFVKERFRVGNLPDRDVAKAILVAIFPAGKRVQAPPVSELLDKLNEWCGKVPGLSQYLRVVFWNIENLSRLRYAKRFTKLTPSQQRIFVKKLSGNTVSNTLLQPAFNMFKATYLTNEEQAKAIHCPYGKPAPSLDNERWMSQVLDAKDCTEDQELEVDAVVLGSGAGGAVAAYELASKGLAVLIIEEGAYYKRDSFTNKSLELYPKFFRNHGFLPAISNTPITFGAAKTVGGTTTVNAGSCFRVPEGIVDNWKKNGLDEFDYKDLGGFFETVEKMIHVKPAEKKHIGPIWDLIKKGAESQGLTELFPMPRNAEGCDGQGACMFGCPSDAKQSTNVSYIPAALQRGAFLYSSFKAEHIQYDGNTATGVECAGVNAEGNPVMLSVKARSVVVAMGSLYTPIFLKKNGITNARLGKNLSIHPCAALSAYYPDKDFRNHEVIPQGFVLKDFADEGIAIEGATIPASIFGLLNNEIGENYVELIERYQQTAFCGFMIRDDSRGSVRPGVSYDFPLISYWMNDGDFKKYLKAMNVIGKMFFATGAKEVQIPTPGKMYRFSNEKDLVEFLEGNRKPMDFVVTAVHPLGTACIASSELKGVCDHKHQVFGKKGLYVMDGSSVPSSLGVNPQMTIMALTTRASQMLAEELLTCDVDIVSENNAA